MTRQRGTDPLHAQRQEAKRRADAELDAARKRAEFLAARNAEDAARQVAIAAAKEERARKQRELAQAGIDRYRASHQRVPGRIDGPPSVVAESVLEWADRRARERAEAAAAAAWPSPSAAPSAEATDQAATDAEASATAPAPAPSPPRVRGRISPHVPRTDGTVGSRKISHEKLATAIALQSRCATQAAIAKKLKVHQSTVSRALTEHNERTLAFLAEQSAAAKGRQIEILEAVAGEAFACWMRAEKKDPSLLHVIRGALTDIREILQWDKASPELVRDDYVIDLSPHLDDPSLFTQRGEGNGQQTDGADE